MPPSRRDFLHMAAGTAGAVAASPLVMAAEAQQPQALRLALICDTHTALQPPEKHAQYSAHLAKVVAAVNARGVDWVLFGGDLTENGRPEEIAEFFRQTRGLTAPLNWVYGNHDVGNKPTPAESGSGIVPSPSRLSRIQEAMGPGHWQRSHKGLRVVGLNTSILGSGLQEEERQWEFLEQALAEQPTSEPTFLLMHYPPFLKDEHEAESPYWNVAPQPRGRLLKLARRANVRQILCGHLHYHLQVQTQGGHNADIPIFVGPAVSFSLPREQRREGWTELEVQPDGSCTTRLHLLHPA